MKKLLKALLVVLMLLSVVGCGKKEETADDTNPLSNLNVRMAMQYAIDRDTLAAALNDGSIPAEGIVPFALAGNPDTGADFREDSGVQCSYDVDKAKEYYAAAKKELGGDISLTLAYGTNEGDSVIKAAELIQYYLEEVGFSVTLNGMPKKERLAELTAHNFDVTLTRWGPDYGDPQTYMDLFVSTNASNNYGAWTNEKYDALIAEAEAAGTSATDRWADFLEAEKVLVNEDAGIVPVFQAGGAMLINPEISGIEFHSAGVDNYRHIVGKDAVTVVSSLDVISMDTCVATDGTSFIAQTMCMAGLMELDANQNAVLDLAESYTLSDDGLVYTFKIRDDAYWSNGTPVTANDFVYAWKRLVDPAIASEYNWILETANIVGGSCYDEESGLTADDLGVKALDDKTLEVTLIAPTGFFLSLMAFAPFFPINEEFCEAAGDQYATSIENMIYCGPYELASWTQGYSYEFKLREDFYDYDKYVAAKNASSVTFRVIADTQTALLEYESGKLDTVILSGEQVDANKNVAGYTDRLQGYLFYLILNINNK